jgi:hypothetical protein
VSRRLLRALAALSLLGATSFGLAAGCSEGQSVVGGACAAGYTQCGNQCIDLDSDPENCGACGSSCPAGIACAFGGCTSGADAQKPDAGDAGPDSASPDALASGDASGDVAESRGSQTDGPATDGPATHDGPQSDGPGNDGPSSDAAPPDAAPSDGAGDGGLGGDGSADEALCTLPLVDCGGQCIDTTMDPGNCGSCGTTCYSGICQSSQCVGETSGALVFIGHDYTSYSLAQARVLSNAVLLPQSSQTLPVLSYERYAGVTPLSNIKYIVRTAATNLGRTLALTSTVIDSDVTTGLTIDKYGVLLVADQPGANPGDLAALGATWTTTLATFTRAGGVVVMLDGDTGVQEMPGLVTSTQLLSVTAQAPVAEFTQLDVAVQTDSVALNVGNPYAAGIYSASFTTEPPSSNVVYVVTTPPGDGGTSSPVVIHKVF